MSIPPWLKAIAGKITGLMAAAAGLAIIVAGIFAVQRIQSARKAGNKAERTAEFIENNTVEIERATKKAEVHRAKARGHAAKADAIKVASVENLRELEAKRGTNTAAALADRLSRL